MINPTGEFVLMSKREILIWLLNATTQTWRVQSIKTHIGKPFDKSITIDNLNLNVIDFIDQSIEIDTHNHRCSFKVSILSIYQYYRFR